MILSHTKRHVTNHILLTMLVVAVASSCSVKEDRSDCPCILSVIFPEGTKSASFESSTMSILTDGSEDQYTFHLDTDLEIREHIVPRGFTSLSVISSNENGVLGFDVVTFPEGCECDRIYAHSSLVDCTGETASDTVHLHKQFAIISLEITGSSAIEELSVIVDGSYNSLGLFNLSPIPGRYRCHARVTGSRYYEVLVPRQKKGELMLYVYDLSESMELASVNLEAILESAHFDWSKMDIDDIKLTLDMESSDVCIFIEKWAQGSAIDEVI